MRVYLDTNFVIRFVEGATDRLDRVVDMADAGTIELVTSELTSAEVLVVPFRLAKSDLVETYETLLSGDGLIEVLPVTRDVLRQSAAIRATIGNKGMDAIHVATAASAGCSVFLSSDTGIRLPPGMKLVTLEAIEAGDPLA